MMRLLGGVELQHLMVFASGDIQSKKEKESHKERIIGRKMEG